MCVGEYWQAVLILSLHVPPSPSFQGLTVLLHGPPGTGKTLAAEAIGYEVGRPLKVSVYILFVYVYLCKGTCVYISCDHQLSPPPEGCELW